MSAVLGIDLSTKAIDLVKLDETTNAATWTRVNLPGSTALERLRNAALVMPGADFYDDVYLAAIEAPMSRGQSGTLAKLSRVFGAIAALIPQSVHTWEVTPVAWRKELGLKGDASKADARLGVWSVSGGLFTGMIDADGPPQDAIDAYAVAYYARQVNARGIAA